MANVTEINQVFRCSVCGNIVEVINSGGGELICCGEAMELLVANESDQGMEKHVPVIEETEKGVKIIVGEVLHPMEEAHYIQWIEVITTDSKVIRKHLLPGVSPEAEFGCSRNKIKEVREYCNIHGMWKK